MDGLSDVGPKAPEQATGADGKIIKMEEDFTERVDAALPKATKLMKSGQLGAGVEALMTLEKGSRLGGDSASNRRLLIAIVDLCREAGDWAALNDNLHALAKKRSLIKQSITKMVERAATFVDDTPTLETKLALIDALRKVTEGKIYVEVERARLTYKLVKMKEAEKNIDEAAKLLLDLQVETFGSMERKEKVELLLEQMRLCLARADFTRAQIISRKISVKFFEEKAMEVQAMKVRFYHMMIAIDEHDAAYLLIARHFLALFNTPKVQADKAKKAEALKSALLFCLLAPYNNEQSDLLHRLKGERAMERMAEYRELAELLTTEEMVDWSREVAGKVEAVLRTAADATTVFRGPAGDKHWDVFQTRVAEHNIRVIAKYYTRISLTRMGQLLAWPVPKTEEFLCKLVVDGTIPGAKIDRPSGVVSFRPDASHAQTLDEWGRDLSCLMDTLNKASHLIQKEEMVHKHLHAAA